MIKLFHVQQLTKITSFFKTKIDHIYKETFEDIKGVINQKPYTEEGQDKAMTNYFIFRQKYTIFMKKRLKIPKV